MRIVSDFREYYDCMQAGDQDRQTLWVRASKPVTYGYRTQFQFGGKEYPLPTLTPYGNRSNIVIHQFVVGFCGQIYPYLEVHNPEDYCSEGRFFCCDAGGVDAFIRERMPRYAEKFFAPRRQARHVKGPWLSVKREEFAAFFEECERKKGAFRGLFEAERCPVFVGEFPRHDAPPPQPGWSLPVTATITFNASLKRFGFAKVFPPAQAYQEISMFMGGLAAPMKPLPELDDVTMAAAKGFDRFSFRQDPIRNRNRKRKVR